MLPFGSEKHVLCHAYPRGLSKAACQMSSLSWQLNSVSIITSSGREQCSGSCKIQTRPQCFLLLFKNSKMKKSSNQFFSHQVRKYFKIWQFSRFEECGRQVLSNTVSKNTKETFFWRPFRKCAVHLKRPYY